jgi:hypothetical protein
MQTEQLQNAYNRTLAHLGISFDDAMSNPMYARCLNRIAEAIERPYIPLPKHEAAKPLAYKD